MHTEIEIPIKHDKLSKTKFYKLPKKNDQVFKGQVLLKSNKDGQIPLIKIINLTNKTFTIQVGQLLGYFSLVDSSSFNKDNFVSYVLFKSLDLFSFLKHLDSPLINQWHALLNTRSNILSKNKHNVGLTKVKYKLSLKDNVPIKGYVLRCTPSMIQAINYELEKLERADFIEMSISLYSAPIVCLKKPDHTLIVTINFRTNNKNIINDTYPMYCIDEQLESMIGSKVFTILDLTKGYH